MRGRDLTADLMGRLSFTDYFYLLVTGREPTTEQRFFLDLLLVAIAEHGLVPTVQAARMTLAADPDSLQGAVAAGILGAGSVILGTASSAAGCSSRPRERRRRRARCWRRRCGRAAETRAGLRPSAPQAGRSARRAHPRTRRRARARRSACRAGARSCRPLVAEVWGKPLPMNVSMPIAAVLLDLDFPPAMIKAIPILARTASLLAHLAEEQETPIGFLMASHGEEAITYEPGTGE